MRVACVHARRMSSAVTPDNCPKTGWLPPRACEPRWAAGTAGAGSEDEIVTKRSRTGQFKPLLESTSCGNRPGDEQMCSPTCITPWYECEVFADALAPSQRDDERLPADSRLEQWRYQGGQRELRDAQLPPAKGKGELYCRWFGCRDIRIVTVVRSRDGYRSWRNRRL